MQTEQIKFNIFKAQNTKADDKCSVVCIEDLINYKSNSKEDSFLIQTYNSGFRVAKDNVDYSKWNGTIFVDIDSKKISKDGEYAFDVNDPVKVNKFKFFYSALLNYIDFNYNVLKASQVSASGISFHLIFYFDCERNEDNFLRAAEASFIIVEDAIKKCFPQDADTILGCQGVIDACTRSVGQGIYISDKDIDIFECSGEFDLSKIIVEEKEFNKIEINWLSDKFKIASNINELPDYDYPTRFKLEWLIFNYTKWDFEKSKELWIPIAKLVSENREEYSGEQGIKKLMYQFSRDFNSSKGKEYGFNRNLMDWTRKNLGFKFNIKKEFKPTKITETVYDKIYNLNEDDRVSSVIEDMLKLDATLIHCNSGCGDGKTYSAKYLASLSSSENILDIVFSDDFSSKIFGRRICFITPMKSINADNFEGVEGWEIIDSDHAYNTKGNINSIKYSSKNICTTWDSFSLYEMEKWGFDVVMIDEVHMLYTAEYRAASIARLKSSINSLKSLGIKTILFTGTPSYEVEEFDCFKVKINRNKIKIDTRFVFYKDTINGWIFDDIRKWTEENKNNLVVVFKDDTNWMTEEAFKKRNFFDIDIYNSRYKEVTERISSENSLFKQITLVSVYGQAGINIYVPNGKKVRIYVLSNDGLAVVQYANRIRNKEAIDRVIIPIKYDNVTNKIRKFNDDVDLTSAENKVEIIKKNRFINDLFDRQQYNKFELLFGLPAEAIVRSGDLISLDVPVYTNWKLCKNCHEYESQTSVLYWRLVENYFDVTFEDADEVVDKINSKYRSDRFAGAMTRILVDIKSNIKITKDNKLYIELDEEVAKVFNNNTKEIIESILNIIYTGDKGETVEIFIKLLSDILSKKDKDKKRIRQNDLTKLYEAIAISKNIEKFADGYYIKMLQDERWGLNKTAAYFVGTLKGIENEKFEDVVEEAYIKFKKVKDSIDSFGEWYENLNIVPNKLDADINISKRALRIIEAKHPGSRTSNSSKKIEFEGVVYLSIKEAMEKTGKSRYYISKNCKSID